MTADGPLYAKFQVERTDRSPKHPDCRYFVLDLDHDPHAVPALRAYAAACEATHPQLAASLRTYLGEGAAEPECRTCDPHASGEHEQGCPRAASRASDQPQRSE